MKKSIFLFFAAILCATSAWAYDLAKGAYVYFEKPSDWTANYVAFMIGHNTWSTAYNMTKISNTNLYYYKQSTSETWSGYTQVAFFSTTSSWSGGENKKIADRAQYAAKATSVYTVNSTAKSLGTYSLFNASMTMSKGTGYAAVINKTQTIKVQLKDGSNWVDATVVPADLKASTYALTSATAAGAKSASLAKESTTVSTTVSAAYSAKVTLSCTNVLDGYVFEGWYDANGNKITSYTVSDAHTVYARFIQSAEETNEVTVTYMCGTTSVATAVTEFVGVDTEKSFTAPTNITGYKFTNWTIGAGIDLKAGTASDATITVVTKSASSDYTLVANYEEVMETIYFINTGEWSVVNLHRWGGTATETPWPGEPMTKTGEKIDKYDVYSFTAKQGAFANVIFTNKNTGSDQTADLVWTAGEYYIYNYGGNSGWYTKEKAEELLVVPVVTYDIVVKAVAPDVWDSGTISIHYWGDGISATSKPVATEKDGNWNKYTIKNVPEGTSVNVIFVNGADWSSNANQTANITGITEDKCFQISAKDKDGEGKCTTTVVDCNATIEPEGSNSLTFNVTVPAGTEACYICGEWDWSSFKEMTKVDATHYTLKVAGAEKTHEYKYACKADWAYAEVREADENGNTNRKAWTASDEVTAWNKPTYTVAGDSEAAFGTTWDPSNTANDMTLEDGLYKWTKTNVALYKNTVIKFQVVKNHDWGQGQWPGNNNDWELKDGIIADGLYTITITFKEADKTINATATKTGDIVTKDFSNQPATLYFHPSFHWTSDAAQFAAYFYNNGPGADATPTWVNMTDGNGDGIYEVANAKQHEYVIICRMNPARTENNWDDDVMWNQIESGITIPNTAGDLNTCIAFWKNCQGDVPTSECTWVAPTPLTDANWSDFVSAYAGKKINAVVERSFNSGQYHTLCLPFDIPTNWLGEGTKAYQLTSIVANELDKLSLNATEWETIVAGKPYIIVPVKGSEYEHVIINGVTVKNASAGTNVVSGDGYKATLKAVTATDGTQTNGSTEYYVGAKDGKLYHNQTSKLGLRALIELTTTSGQPLPPKVRAQVTTGENIETGIEDIFTTDAPIKVIENGQLIIIRDGVKYNVQGQKL